MKNLFYLLFVPVLLMGCNGAPQYNDPIPEHDNFKIESVQVNETRVINVWTPPEYEGSIESFPVIYMLDGGIQEDFPHIANTISELIHANKIPPIILVGIENTERRRDLTGPSSVKENAEVAPITDGAKKFRAFIHDELFAEIDKRYRTTSKKGIIGESVAGMFIVETLLLQPDMFDYYIAMDPSLWWNDNHLVKSSAGYLAKFPNKEIRFWFAGSSAEDISPYTNQLADVLKTNAPESLTWIYSDEPNEKHTTIFRATKEKALIWTLLP